jgi:hypothetical protein
MRAPWWQWPNILSLDAPLIALVWQEAFARAFAVPVSLAERVLIFLVVWSVYAADHVADGLRLGAPEGATARHRFAHRHSGPLLILLVAAATAGLALVPTLPARVFSGGAVLAAIVAVYFLWNHFAGRKFARSWAKEFVVGLVFAVGCALGPFTTFAPDFQKLVAVTVFALVCTSNCLLISRLEREVDIRRGETSLAVHLPPHTRPARIVALLAGVASLTLLTTWPALALSLILSAFGIWCGVLVERRHGPEFAAVWADAVLLSPVLTWPWLEFSL